MHAHQAFSEHLSCQLFLTPGQNRPASSVQIPWQVQMCVFKSCPKTPRQLLFAVEKGSRQARLAPGLAMQIILTYQQRRS